MEYHIVVTVKIVVNAPNEQIARTRAMVKIGAATSELPAEVISATAVESATQT